ncbi:hypothetical protein LJ555_11740 [Lacticaseibacillus paracasei]|jgi:rubrerythrin|uniref:hypothetical protein n=1 Tax=Lacticaseibacillus paracasei TaxID=1597 RepID=UPI0003A7C263|nr:hypothetical protein [Lacticaseibacillus paracasei]AWR91948.1 hypothetical protein DMC16_12890 [Lacticaseibacillus paracasei]MCT3362067.1 hypothetical protein [Lacticaseibacillus paracasei]UNG77824.1 hypothetical protein LJ555_11740 [Lacticaseibacillus paracasei]
MAKKFNLGSKSDMRRFMRAIEEEAKDKASDAIINHSYDFECPKCGTKFMVRVGSPNVCPKCGTSVNLKFDKDSI